jgi:hypothetical protein
VKNLNNLIGGKLLLVLALTFAPCYAQEQSPLPGNSENIPSEPVQSPAIESAPIPGISSIPQSNTSTSLIPVSTPFSLTALQALVADLKTGQSPITEDTLDKHLTWIDTLIKAHNKLAATFSKQESTQTAYTNERNLSKQLFEIKDQILYLKAITLMKENRWPEAINILVDIIAVEPQSPLGQQAYKRLIEAGFSPDTHQLSFRLPKSKSPPHKIM